MSLPLRACLLAAWVLAVASSSLGAKDLTKPARGSVAERTPAAAVPDARLTRALAALTPQRPGHPDLYVLGFAGDGSETVFRNEVLHLRNLAGQRLDARGHVLALANHSDQSGVPELPLASLENLQRALGGIGRTMDPSEDLLLLYFTTHGSDDHRLLLRRDRRKDRLLEPGQIRAALDASGIRHRVVVISACYSGGFAKALSSPDTLLLMAARRDRPSFGCGNDSVATYFGRAWLVDALNQSVDFVHAFDLAKRDIQAREKDEGLRPSLPQIEAGRDIVPRLAAWRASFTPGPPLRYPHEEIDEADRAEELTPLRPAGNKSNVR